MILFPYPQTWISVLFWYSLMTLKVKFCNILIRLLSTFVRFILRYFIYLCIYLFIYLVAIVNVISLFSFDYLCNIKIYRKVQLTV